MKWFYAEGSLQKGPLNDVEFIEFARQGTIKPGTLVWHEGLPEWQPLSRVRPDLTTSGGAPVIGGIAVPEQNKDLLVQQMREGAFFPGGSTNPYGLRYAGFWIRTAAKLIDGLVNVIVLVPVVLLLFAAAGVFSGDFDRRLNSGDPDAMVPFIAAYGGILLGSVLYQLGYNGLMVWKWGATLGKMAVGVKVVTAEGQPLTLGRSIGRAAADMINNFICNGITYIMVGIDEPEKRGLHDHICGTRVIYK